MANSTQPISSLLTQNNNIEIASLAAAVFFGCIAVYGLYQQYRYRLWERRLDAHDLMVKALAACALSHDCFASKIGAHCSASVISTEN